MAGHYYKAKDDGALWRCTECKELFPHGEVILFEPKPGEVGPILGRRIICLGCVDRSWLDAATCLGSA